MRVLLRGTLSASLLAAGAFSGAIDHGNLDDGRPSKLEDAYSIAAGELALEAGVGFERDPGGAEQAVFPLEFLYGALPNLQVSLGSTFLEPRRGVDAPKSGDIQLGALYNLNQETLQTPALGVKAEGRFPTGAGSSATGGEVKLLVTKSVGRLSLHLNAGHEFLDDPRPAARGGRHRLVAGGSYPLGAPRRTRTTLVVDGFVEQSRLSRGDEAVGAEIGVRRQLTRRIVWDAGLGREFSGPSDRLAFYFTTGLAAGF